MKVVYKDKKRTLPEWPSSISEMRKVISRKFTERNLFEDGNIAQILTTTTL